MYTRLTGWALNGSVWCCTLSASLHLGLRGQHHLAVHARRHAAGIALRHPPHAQQRVGARAEHQLLQTADPLEVPRLRRREDPLPQPPYALLAGTPINGASRGARPLVRSPRRSSWRPTCPSVPGSSSSSSSQAHLTASAPFRVRARGPYPASYPGRPAGGASHHVPVSCCLSAAGIRFSVIRFPPRDWAFLTVGLPGQRPGPRRGYHVPHARATTGVGAPSTPRTAVLIPAEARPQPAPAASQRPVPAPRSNIPSAGLRITRHQRGFKQFTRPVFPSPVAPGWNGQPLGFPPSFAPRRPGAATHVGVGTGHRARTWNYATRHQPILQSACSLVSVRPRVATAWRKITVSGPGAASITRWTHSPPGSWGGR